MAIEISVNRRGFSSHLWLIKVSVIKVVNRFAVKRVKMVTAKLKSLRYMKRMHNGTPQMYQKKVRSFRIIQTSQIVFSLFNALGHVFLK